MSSEQDEGLGGSTASGNSNGNNSNPGSANVSNATSTTTLASAIFGSVKRHQGKCGKLEDTSRWFNPNLPTKPGAVAANGNDVTNGSVANQGFADIKTISGDFPVLPLGTGQLLIESNKNVMELVTSNPSVAHLVGSAVLSKPPNRQVSRTRVFTRQVHYNPTQHRPQQQHNFDTTDEEDNVPQHKSRKQAAKENSVPKAPQRQIRVGKTTTVLFAVTLAYILSFLPYLTVMVLRSVIKDLEENLSPVGELAYKLCVKSFFINNAINPLIYSFLNQTFRQDARLMLRKCCGTNKRTSPRVRTHPAPDAV